MVWAALAILGLLFSSAAQGQGSGVPPPRTPEDPFLPRGPGAVPGLPMGSIPGVDRFIAPPPGRPGTVGAAPSVDPVTGMALPQRSVRPPRGEIARTPDLFDPRPPPTAPPDSDPFAPPPARTPGRDSAPAYGGGFVPAPMIQSAPGAWGVPPRVGASTLPGMIPPVIGPPGAARSYAAPSYGPVGGGLPGLDPLGGRSDDRYSYGTRR